MVGIKFQYIFDPLCGWCYASAPALAELAKRWPNQLEILPSGLFSEKGARDMTPDWANYAWTCDQRIACLTGLDFTESYQRNVLMNSTLRFDSSAINRALTEALSINPPLEPLLLKQLQVERYVQGRDTSNPAVVAQITANFLTQYGWKTEAKQFSHRLEHDQELAVRTAERLLAANKLMNQYGVQGVPQLLAVEADKTHVVPSSALYQGADTLIAQLQKTLTLSLT